MDRAVAEEAGAVRLVHRAGDDRGDGTSISSRPDAEHRVLLDDGQPVPKEARAQVVATGEMENAVDGRAHQADVWLVDRGVGSREDGRRSERESARHHQDRNRAPRQQQRADGQAEPDREPSSARIREQEGEDEDVEGTSRRPPPSVAPDAREERERHRKADDGGEHVRIAEE